MFGSIGVPELIMIFLVALLLFGPRKLPEIGRSLGKALGEFRRASNDLKRTLEEEVASDHLREIKSEVRAAAEVAAASVPAPSSAAPPESPGTPAPPVQSTDVSPREPASGSDAAAAPETVPPR
jgi:sec-independent protein translocase protein TatA